MVLEETPLKVLVDLRRKRGVIKAALTRISNFVKTFDPKVEAVSLLDFRQEELPQINKKFDEIQTEIELFCPDETIEAEQERDDFERNYFAVRSQIQEIINSEKCHTTSGHDISLNSTAQTYRARLAPIDLPKFSGNIQEWESFFDCFKVMVHQDDYYSPSQKFYYLRSTLSGQALDLIRSFPMSDANYHTAIRKLQERYDNKGLVIQSHIREILDSPRVESASSHELLKLQSHISPHVAALEVLNQPTQNWDAWLVTIIIERLDNTTSHEWQLRQTNTELPTYTQLMEFLSSRCIAFESSETLATKLKTTSKEVPISKITNNKRHNAGKTMHGTLLASSNTVENKCVCCFNMHKLYACTKFRELPMSERINLVRQAKLCFNCLYPSHTVEKCKSKYTCQICKKRHNSLLHFENRGEATTSQSQGNIEEITPTPSEQDYAFIKLIASLQFILSLVRFSTPKFMYMHNAFIQFFCVTHM